MFLLFSSFSKEMLVYAHLIGQHDISGHAGPLQAVAGCTNMDCVWCYCTYAVHSFVSHTCQL